MEKTNILRSKKGNLLDWFLVIPILFMTAICVIVAFIIISVANQTNVFQDTPEAQHAVDVTRTTILSFDNIMLFVIVGLSIFVLVSSAMVYQHPALFIISLVLLFIAITVAGVVSNTWFDFSNQSNIVQYSQAFPKIKFLMEKLPFYILFMGFAAAIVGVISYSRQ